jgi:hypothetical protein
MSRTVVTVNEIAVNRFSVVHSTPSGLSEFPGGPDLTRERVVALMDTVLGGDSTTVVLRRDGSDTWLETLARAALGMTSGPLDFHGLTLPDPVREALTRIAAAG